MLVIGEEHSYNSREFWPAISRREHKWLNPCCGTKAIVFSFSVSEGHKSGCDSPVPATDVILAQVNHWSHRLAFTLIALDVIPFERSLQRVGRLKVSALQFTSYNKHVSVKVKL